MKPQRLKRVCIKEELVALTGHYITALILNQFIYWSERTDDTDKFLEEELSRNPDLDIQPLHGWVFKKAEELRHELMLDISAVTLRRYITKLIDQNLVNQRSNPHQKYDRTLQYRPNIVEIQKQLQALGYALEGYPLQPAPALNLQNEGREDKSLQPAPALNLQNEASNLQNEASNLQNEAAITEITPEISSKIKESLSLTLSHEPEPEEREREFKKPKPKTEEATKEESLDLIAELPEPEREEFVKFAEYRANLLPSPPVLVVKWIAANFTFLYNDFLKSPQRRQAKKKAAIDDYDWRSDPRFDTWIHEAFNRGAEWVKENEAEREQRYKFERWAMYTNAYEGICYE